MTKKKTISEEVTVDNRKDDKHSIRTRRAAGKRGPRKKKKMTQAVLDANRANGKKSAGPRTAAGKLIASRNAITHGFFARELVLNDQERRRLETIRRSLHPQLEPETVLQHLKFAEIMVWIGRCLLGLRLDMRYITWLLGLDNSPQAQPDQTEAVGARPEWYLSGKQGLREGIRLIDAIQREFLSLGRIDEKWYAVLDQAFGPRFRELLTQWVPSNEQAVMLADHLIMHAKTYNLPLPPVYQEASTGEGGNKVKVILDPEQSKQMIIKLLDLQGSMLSDLWRSVEQRASSAAREQNVASDPPRHFSAASRELDRAIDRFMYLKKNNL